MLAEPDFSIELIKDNSINNLLLILNIVATVSISFFGKEYIEKRLKEYETKIHIDKIVAEKTILYYVKVNKILTKICHSQTISNSITEEDLIKINEIKFAEENVFIPQTFLTDLNSFIDYLYNLRENPELKNLETEKYFFFKIRMALNA